MTIPNSILTVTIDPTWPLLALWQQVTRRVPYLLTNFYDLESGILENVNNNNNTTDIIGRSEAFLTYVNNSNRTVPIKFTYRVQGLNIAAQQTGGPLPPGEADRVWKQAWENEVGDPVKWLDGVRYPWTDPASGIPYPPPPLILRVGELLRMRCIIDTLQIAWVPPFSGTLLPLGADVDATFQAVTENPRNYDFNGPNRLWGGSGGQTTNTESPRQVQSKATAQEINARLFANSPTRQPGLLSGLGVRE